VKKTVMKSKNVLENSSKTVYLILRSY